MTILKTARQKQANNERLTRNEKRAIRQSEKHKRMRMAMIDDCVTELTARHERCAVIADRYVITDAGRFFIATGKGWREGKPGVKPGGYLFVGISGDGKIKYRMIHRLVAESFIPNPHDLPEVNHIDGNKLNNSASNLEWVTRKQNARHAVRHGLMCRGESVHGSKLTEQEVRIIRESSETCRMAGERFGVCAQTVNNIRRGKVWRHVE